MIDDGSGSVPLRIDPVLGFQGYGNPAGRFWFVGMEEHGAKTEADIELELEWRSAFRPIEDLIAVHEQWDREFRARASDRRPFDPRRLIPTWGTMSKLVLRLSGCSEWEDLETVRDYQSKRLGRLDGETFLTELLPLPAPNSRDWPELYHGFFPDRDAYVGAVVSERIRRLRALLDQHQPEYVFCYGKVNWKRYREVFKPADVQAILGGRMEVGRVGTSTTVLTPFFARHS